MQVIKDYEFRSTLAVQSEIVILSLIACCSCTVLVLPYALILIIMGFVMAVTKSHGALCRASNRLNLVILALVLIDLPAKYLIKAFQLINGAD